MRAKTERSVSGRRYKKLLNQYNNLMVDRNKLFELLSNSVNLTRCRFCNEYNKSGYVCCNCHQDDSIEPPADSIFDGGRLEYRCPDYIRIHIPNITKADEVKIVNHMKKTRSNIIDSIEHILITKKLIKANDNE